MLPEPPRATPPGAGCATLARREGLAAVTTQTMHPGGSGPRCSRRAALARLGALGLAWPARAPARAAAFETGLLWRLERPGHAASHLFGTLHLADPRVTTLPPAAEAAFDAARVLVVELLDDPRSAQVFAATSQLPPGTDLRAQAGDAVFERVAARLAERYGLPPEASARLQPWAAYLTLSQPAGRAGEILDAALQRRARARARPVVPLETVEAQLATLAAVRPAHMLALLDALARRHDEAMAAIDELIARYRAEDLAGLLALETQAADDEPALRPAIDDLLAQLLQRRNATMAERLAPLLARDASFVAVGALHLLGPDGLPARLARAGWRVRRVVAAR